MQARTARPASRTCASSTSTKYDARILDDVRYERFGAGAKAIEWGIAVHQGQEYGWVNRYVMLLGCLAIVTLAISSLTMW
jgi:uncharacterized iron-regulated membrane protein